MSTPAKKDKVKKGMSSSKIDQRLERRQYLMFWQKDQYRTAVILAKISHIKVLQDEWSYQLSEDNHVA